MTLNTFVLKNATEFEDNYDYRFYKRDNLEQIQGNLTPEIQHAFQEFQFAKTLFEKPQTNPTNLTNPYWQWVIKYDLSADDIGDIFAPDTYGIPPFWGCERMGQSKTILPDGREILIGGEWEDSYDPMFWIYNDVIVKYPDGNVEIFGYPRHIFAPNDFHTATLVGDTIWIIGSIGYPDERDFSQTSVYKLNIHSYKIEKVETRNSMGWVHNHSAVLKDNQIIVSGGEIFSHDTPIYENIDNWLLNLRTLIWKNITKKQWQGFYVQRKDVSYLSLNDYDSMVFAKKVNWQEHYESNHQRILEKTGIEPDLELFNTLFSPPLAHEIDESEQQYDTVTIFIEGIKIRYVAKRRNLQVYIEGILPEEKLELLQENLRHKLSKLENMACEVKLLF